MISTFLQETSNGGFYSFPNNNVQINLQEGFGIPGSKGAMHEYELIDGGLLISQYYGMRRITLGGIVYGNTQAAFEDAKASLTQAFTFKNALKTLKMTTGAGVAVQASVIVAPGSELIISESASTILWANWKIDLLSPDAYIYSQTEQTVDGTKTTITAGFAIPTPVPISITGGVSNPINVSNAGNALIYPTSIIIFGAGTGFTITNRTTSQSIVYSGTLADGDYVTIDCKAKTAVKNGSTNVIANLADPNWIQLAQGTNTFTFTIDSGDTSTTKLRIVWRSGYISI